MANRTSLILVLLLSLAPTLTAEEHPAGPQGPGDGVVTLYRPDEDERQTFRYRNAEGKVDPAAMAEIRHFFRCRLTAEEHEVDPVLIETLDVISDRFGGQEVRIISGYRSPTRNALMRKQGRRVAKNSLHMKGMAADIEIEGISPVAIRDESYALRRGGVGYYGRNTFVHVDTGELRTWGWRPGPPSGKALAKNTGRPRLSR